MKTTFYKISLLISLSLSSFITQAQWTKVSSDGATDLLVHNNMLYAAGTKISNSTDGSVWTESSTGLTGGGSPNCIRSYDGNLYVGGNGSSYYMSTDNGATWTLKNGRSGLTSVKTTGIYVDGTNITYGTTGSGKWQYSTNGGTSWSGSDIPWGVSPGNIGPDIVKLGSNIYSCGYDYVFKSADNGKNWDTTNKFGATNSLCVQGNTLYCAGYGSGVNKSTDGGATWSCILGCTITDQTRSAARIISSGNNVFVGGGLGKVNHTTDNGVNWTDLSGDGSVLASMEIIQALAVFKNELYVATSTGIYKRSFSGNTGVSEQITKLQITLYPNPATDKLFVNVPNAEISIMDLQGKLVKQTSNETTLDVSQLQQGVYFVKVVANGEVMTSKFVKQ